MKCLISLAAVVLLAGTAQAAVYTSNFEAEGIGTLPAPWTVFSPWGDWAPGPITANVQSAPGGGQALKIVWGTDWASYGASSGEADCTLDMTGLDGATAQMHLEYDFYKINWRVWQAAGDQTWFPPGGLHMNDNPALPGEMVVGTDDYNSSNHLYGVPEGAWIHVVTDFDAATDLWMTNISYPGGGGGFSGSSPLNIAGQFWFGGWAFQVAMDAAPAVPYDNAVYIDNFTFSVVPEPASLALLALGALALRKR